MTGISTIYVVDDHEAVRDSLAMLLSTEGLVVQQFGCGADFLSALDPEQHGCVLLDLRLPDMTGIEVQKRLTDMGAKVQTIMISGYGDIPMAVKAMKSGALDFIEKPYSDEAILESIRRAVIYIEKARAHESSSSEVAYRLSCLTPREHDVLLALVAGHPNKVIAGDLGISPRTVEIHRARVMSKMQARSLSHLVRMAFSVGLDLDES